VDGATGVLPVGVGIMMLEDLRGVVVGIANASRTADAGPVSTRSTIPCIHPHGRGGNRFDQLPGRTRVRMATIMSLPISISWHDPATDDGTIMSDNLINNHGFNAYKAVVCARRSRTLKQGHFHFSAEESRRKPGAHRSGLLPEGHGLPLFEHNGSPLVQIKMRMEV
jgi:hypothetical protein